MGSAPQPPARSARWAWSARSAGRPTATAC